MKHDNDNTQPLRFLSVCSGIEAASVAWPQWEAVAFAEIEKFPSAVLAHHYPDVPNLGDFTKIDTTTLGQVDILCGGTPCQAFSVAGARRGLDDERGNLTLSFVELAHELAGHGKTAGNGLRNVVWENVPGVLSDKGNAFGCFLAGLVGADNPILPPKRWTSYGMVSGPKGRAAWAVKDAQFYGLAQRRKRVIVVADFGNGADPAAVLFEPESVYRNTPPSRESRETITHDVAPSLRAQGNASLRADSEAYVAANRMVAFGEYTEDGTASALKARDYKDATDLVASASVAGAICRDSFTGGAGGRPEGAAAGHFIPVAFDCKASGQNGFGTGYVAPTLRAMGSKNNRNSGGGHAAIASSSFAVRRLTPTECERLQGFPDGYTDIPWRGQTNSPDGPRYKALGNSWAVPKFKWLGERIARLMPVNDTTPHHTEEHHAA